MCAVRLYMYGPALHALEKRFWLFVSLGTRNGSASITHNGILGRHTDMKRFTGRYRHTAGERRNSNPAKTAGHTSLLSSVTRK